VTLRAQRAQGHEVGAISLRLGDAARMELRNVDQVSVVALEAPAPRLATRATELAAWLALGRAAIARYVERFGKPDLLHAHNLYPAGILAALVGRLERIPVCVTEHSSRWALGAVAAWQRALCRRALAGCDALLTVSESLARDVRAVLGPLAERAVVVPNLLDDEFVRRPLAAPPPRRPFRLIAIGNLVPEKDHAALLRAFAASRDGDQTLTIVGNGPLAGELHALAGRLFPDGAVSFLPPTSRAGIADALAASHALVLPSLYETFGVVGIEALACGRPLVCTRSCGVSEQVGERDGIVVGALDEPALAAALREVRARYDRFDPAAIRNAALERFSPSTVAARLGEVYRQIAIRSSESSRRSSR
jgi:glycosyltransferase involved in cell wall biosynthesis